MDRGAGVRPAPRGRRHRAAAGDGERIRVVLTEQPSRRRPRAHPAGLCATALIAAYGTDFGVHSPTWISRFTDMTRQAASYRAGRVLLAGDAAHVHPPQGGQGLNIGVQDAVNLGWKLAQVVSGTSPDSLLDTYHAERHPVARPRAAQHDGAGRAERDRRRARTLCATSWPSLLGLDEPRKHIAGMVSGLDIHYDLGEGHPLLGRRMPDLDLVTADGPIRVYSLLHDARPVLAEPRRARRLRPHAVGGPGAAGRGYATTARGSCPCSARSPRPRRCWSGPTATSPGWETSPTRASRTR